MSLQPIEHYRVPIGGLSFNETALISANHLYADDTNLSSLFQDWEIKSANYQTTPRNLLVLDSDLLPLQVSQSIQSDIDALLEAFKHNLPPRYELKFVPIDRLVSPQKNVIIERARSSFGGATSGQTDDQNAKFCLGSQPSNPSIEVTLTGNQQSANQFAYQYQFLSDNQDIRIQMPSPFRPTLLVDHSTAGSNLPWMLNTIPIAVSGGTPQVMISKILMGQDKAQNKLYRLIIQNGVHRIFRLAELGNTHVAALVYELTQNELRDPVVETPKSALLTVNPRPISLLDVVDPNISRSFKWKKSKKLARATVTVQFDYSFVS